MKDILGTALLDFYHGKYTEDIITETNISEEDILPLPYFFRTHAEMPQIERKALQLSKGKVLDIGCGAGCHALYLQEKGLPVTAIDTSEGAVEVCTLRGIKDARCIDLIRLENEKFDTILLLMNGTGIFQKLEFISVFLDHLKSLLTPKGQILIDSSDLRYMYDEGEDGGIWIPGDSYYGELEFSMKYKGEESDVFDWLYLDERIFETACIASGLHFEVLTRGENFDYLARITVAENNPA
ncbi:class I SAM-dependent methyltransferase [Ulvibacter litoralis]|uniref:Methyltransferase domain-containing protein n=1 Tax=Ulvibacter litoralis TaxID=227084 RepID=A0A1G7INS1_9FLAO|nr:class I SAM-dependent methyltransferase [Ulvibacter litoralis]GHC61453.1 SAM-dependent methyltransferase [Ulvibacter litoralis]SDF14228.1 Methyltransferase domain-containing protein [Ulvibacter litoralis]